MFASYLIQNKTIEFFFNFHIARYVDNVDGAIAGDVTAVIAMAPCDAVEQWAKQVIPTGKLFLTITRE